VHCTVQLHFKIEHFALLCDLHCAWHCNTALCNARYSCISKSNTLHCSVTCTVHGTLKLHCALHGTAALKIEHFALLRDLHRAWHRAWHCKTALCTVHCALCTACLTQATKGNSHYFCTFFPGRLLSNFTNSLTYTLKSATLHTHHTHTHTHTHTHLHTHTLSPTHNPIPPAQPYPPTLHTPIL